MGMGFQRQATAALNPGKRQVTHHIGGRVGRKVSMDGYGKLRLTGI
jgi:hypothetical protein